MIRSRIRGRLLVAYVAVAVCLVLGGCDDSARQRAQVRPQEIRATPAPQTAKQSNGTLDVRGLPFSRTRGSGPMLAPRPKSGAELLAAWAEAEARSADADTAQGRHGAAHVRLEHARQTLLTLPAEIGVEPPIAQALAHVDESLRRLATVETAEATAQKPEPTLVEQIAAVELPESAQPDPSLTAKAAAEVRELPHDLPLTVNDTVLQYLNFFQTTRGRAIVSTGLRRAGRYREMIAQVLREEGLPGDLIYLAQAESAFQPRAVSRAGARGIWQFMAWRAHEYGLERSWWVDERQDPEKATRAAARHLRDLYEMFGDWYLAIAAYDCGPGNVSKGVERTGYADFWELYKRNVLPKETRNYVPIILALTLVGKDTARYGIEVDPEPPLRADRIQPGHPVSLRLVSETLDVDIETLQLLNPHLLRMRTPPDPQFELRVPAGLGPKFAEAMSDIPPEKWASWRRHRVEPGDTLAGLARTFHVTPDQIVEANHLEPGTPLAAGAKMIIPTDDRTEAGWGKLTRYRVRKGETLAAIAEQFDVTPAEIRSWNGMRSDRVSRGMVLRVYPGGKPAITATKSKVAPGKSKAAPVTRERAAARAASDSTVSSAAPERTVHHLVKAGETLWSIARAYQTTVDALKRANRFLATRPLQVGDQLTILPPR